MELDPLPDQGLRIYVGDTGIGLASGISKSYGIGNLSHVKAVEMSMTLADQIERRRTLPGPLAFGGRGLEHVGVMLKRLRGTISMQTGHAMAEFAPTKKRKPLNTYKDLYHIQGTHVHIKIPTRWKAL